MATKDKARKIEGAVIQGGRLYKAGEEDALAKVLPQSDVDRLVEKAVLSGNWGAGATTAGENAARETSGAAEGSGAAAPTDEPETPAAAPPGPPTKPAKAAKRAQSAAKKGR